MKKGASLSLKKPAVEWVALLPTGTFAMSGFRTRFVNKFHKVTDYIKKTPLLLACGLSVVVAEQGVAAVSADKASTLGESLTPFGAEMAGNASGSIPAWTGGIQKEDIPASYKGQGQHHPDPYAGDKPLFTITAQNLAEHQGKLSPGQVALFKTYPETFKMMVYPTRRSHSAPQWVVDNTLENATRATLASDGNGIDNAYGGIPFPIPESALEVIWNHIVRWRGSYVVRDSSEVAVQSNGKYVLVSGHTEVDFIYYRRDGGIDTLDNMIFYYLNTVNKPARLAGGATLVHEKLNQSIEPRQAWIYNAGLRRVRRAPNLSFDAPISESEGLRTADDTDMFNGSPMRFNWALKGKRELYIPYNSYALGSSDLTYEQILQKGHVNPDHARYELHRVWEVEATLKEGERHIYQRRTFFIDEDSWSIAVADQYDGRNQLWRVSMAHLKNYYEVPVTWTTLDVYHDLQAKRYHVQFLDNEESSTLEFSYDYPSSGQFQPAALRRLGRR